MYVIQRTNRSSGRVWWLSAALLVSLAILGAFTGHFPYRAPVAQLTSPSVDYTFDMSGFSPERLPHEPAGGVYPTNSTESDILWVDITNRPVGLQIWDEEGRRWVLCAPERPAALLSTPFPVPGVVRRLQNVAAGQTATVYEPGLGELGSHAVCTVAH